MVPIRIGLVGTGFIGSLFARAAAHMPDLQITRTLTRRPIDTAGDFPAPQTLTNSSDDLLDHCDVVLECSGDVWHAAELVEKAVQWGLPVATLNSTFHITVGSDFVGRGLVSECEGDQPGSLADLKRRVVGMGFKPLVYGSTKGFLDPDPTPESMAHWSKVQGISLPMVTSFTDGTKLAIEQVLVANGCDATIPAGGMLGPQVDTLEQAATILGEKAQSLSRSLSDYVLSRALPHGVFVLATHDEEQAAALAYLKCGNGPIYTIFRPAIFAHLEAMNSIRELVQTRRVLLDNSRTPRLSVAAVAKRALAAGNGCAYGVGSFDFRGTVVSISDHINHVPIGLISNARLRRPLERDQLLTFDDIDLPDGKAMEAWQRIVDREKRSLS